MLSWNHGIKRNDNSNSFESKRNLDFSGEQEDDAHTGCLCCIRLVACEPRNDLRLRNVFDSWVFRDAVTANRILTLDVFQGRGNAKSKDQTDMVFQKLDINQDGVITFEEFIESCLKVKYRPVSAAGKRVARTVIYTGSGGDEGVDNGIYHSLNFRQLALHQE